MQKERVLVTGAGGFIGHHLVKFLKEKGYWVRGVDIKYPEFERSPADEYKILDLREFANCAEAVSGAQEIYQLAADMGGIGYITSNHALIFRNNALINLHMLEASRQQKVERYLFSSSACIYPGYLQDRTDMKALKEEDAYPAQAEPGYGWEKLFSELACEYYRNDYNMPTHVVRFHNIFGPQGTYEGGKEKSPAAICRKIVLAKEEDQIEIWGDGQQTRSYCYIDDCVEGIYRLMQSQYYQPINIGTDRMLSIDELVDIVAAIAKKRISKYHNLLKPQGVRGRNADIAKAKEVLKWQPRVSLEDGLAVTYQWIAQQLEQKKT